MVLIFVTFGFMALFLFPPIYFLDFSPIIHLAIRYRLKIL